MDAKQIRRMTVALLCALMFVITFVVPSNAQGRKICVTVNGNTVCGSTSDIISILQALPEVETPVEEDEKPEMIIVNPKTTSTVSTQNKVTVQALATSDWSVEWFPAATFDRGDGTTFQEDAEQYVWRSIAPSLWPTYPNVANPLVPEFPVKIVDGAETVPWGIEYGMDEANFCQQNRGEECTVPIAPQSVFYYTGDYVQPGVGECIGSLNHGCMLVIVNVGLVAARFDGEYHQGFAIKDARYWHGGPEQLPMGLWGLISHGVANMTNQDTVLNTPMGTNAGGNCSTVDGCETVEVRVHFTSGNEPLAQWTTTWVATD